MNFNEKVGAVAAMNKHYSMSRDYSYKMSPAKLTGEKRVNYYYMNHLKGFLFECRANAESNSLGDEQLEKLASIGYTFNEDPSDADFVALLKDVDSYIARKKNFLL